MQMIKTEEATETNEQMRVCELNISVAISFSLSFFQAIKTRTQTNNTDNELNEFTVWHSHR